MPDSYWTDFAREMKEQDAARRRALAEQRKKKREGEGAVCVECGVTFQKNGKRKRCDTCVVAPEIGSEGIA